MADPTQNEIALEEARKLAAAARDQGIEQLENAKGQLADGAERIAAAVDRTADELAEDNEGAISGYGRSLANLMRQLAGGLRERDIEQFAGELGLLARRNPGMFLAGSVALGFGVARFFKARAPQRESGYDQQDDARAEESRGTFADRREFDPDESLDLSANPARAELREGEEPSLAATGGASTDTSGTSSAGQQPEAAPGAEQERATKSRSAGKGKAKPQRASTDAGGKES
jgi:hypothetical protein